MTTLIPTEICLAFKRNSSNEKIVPRIKYNLIGFTFIHVELIWPVRCNGTYCIYCQELSLDPDKARNKLTNPPSQKHMLSYTVLERDPVRFRVDRAFNADYEFMTIPMTDKTGFAKSFLQTQIGKPYRLLWKQKLRWLRRGMCSCWILCCCQRRCQRDHTIAYKMIIDINEKSLENQPGWFCSELIAVALNESGFNLIVDSPDALYASICNVKNVKATHIQGVRVAVETYKTNEEKNDFKNTSVQIEPKALVTIISTPVVGRYELNRQGINSTKVSLLRLSKNNIAK